jgi:hypothetical protein
VGQSIFQSLLAVLSGALYLAIRLSMGSIIPAMIIHITRLEEKNEKIVIGMSLRGTAEKSLWRYKH